MTFIDYFEAAGGPPPTDISITFDGLPGDYATVIDEQYATPEGVHFSSNAGSYFVSADVSLLPSPQGGEAAFILKDDNFVVATITVAIDTVFVTPLTLETSGAPGVSAGPNAGQIRIYDSSDTLLNADIEGSGGVIPYSGESGGWTEMSIVFAGNASYFEIVNDAGTQLAIDNITFKAP